MNRISRGLVLAIALVLPTTLSGAESVGSHRRGKAVFAQRGCAACHAVDGKTASLGPDLSVPENINGITEPLTRPQLLEAVSDPSKKIRKGYESFAVELDTGKVVTGRITQQADDSITLVSPSPARALITTVIPRDEIEEIVEQKVSVMPKGLLKDLRDVQVDDLLAYLETITDPTFEAPAKPTLPEKSAGVTREPEAADAEFYSPQESMKRIHVAPGYHLELVAAEPMIEEPVLCVWDGNSRMYVAEMRTYMQDIDGTDQDLPKSRVSMLEDTNGDGVMDKVSRFADNMVLPRMILPLDDRIIINETYTEDYYSYRDTDGDGVADEKILLYDGGKAGGNLEHQNSGMLWGTDNWIYTARTGSKRHRFIGGKWTAESLYGDNGQWGLAMNDMGRLFLSAAGGEKPGYGFQQLPHYGKLELSGDREQNFEAVYPIVKMTDVQGGLGRVDKDRGGLNRFTGCAGQSIYRGDRLPQDFHGDYIVPEPVGRLVRRAKVSVMDGKYVLSNAYENSEFIASTDKNFRPLWSATGPDGCLYIVDMYRGIIQEGNWTRKGSYLREVIDREGLDKNVGRGRIYRVVHDTTLRDVAPKMLEQSTTELVQQLSHPNGWRRDTAQKLIVLRGDLAVVPQLKQLAANGQSSLGRMHALWTLDGLQAAGKQTILAGIRDIDPLVSQTAMRIGEPLLAKDSELVQTVGEAGYGSDDMTVVVQAINSLRFAKTKDSRKFISEIAGAYPDSDIVMASSQSSLNHREGGGGPSFAKFDKNMLAKMQHGYQAYTMVCIRCHGPDGNGAISSDGLQLAPPLDNSPRLLGPPQVAAGILLHGLTGPVDGKKYPGVMESMKRQDDRWIASALTYVRNSFGNLASVVEASDVAAVRSATADRTTPFTIVDFAAYQAVAPEVVRSWKFGCSSNSNPRHAVDGDPKTRFDTQASQEPGQWFQIDMGERYELTSLVLDTTASAKDFPRGYEVRVSDDDGATWSEPVATGKAASAVTSIALAPGCTAGQVRIIQTGKRQGNHWSIHELSIYGRKSDGASASHSLGAEPTQPGAELYHQSCVQCHGRSGAGRIDADLKPLAASIAAGSQAVRNRAALIRIALSGLTGGESTCTGLSSTETEATEVTDLLNYIRTSFHKGLPAITADQVQQVLVEGPQHREPVTRSSLTAFLPVGHDIVQTWALQASHRQRDINSAIDNDHGSRWSVGESMKPGMWFSFDMRQSYKLRTIVLDSTRSAGDYPRGFEVYVSADGENWGEPILTGDGSTAVTEFVLPADTTGQHVKIEQTGHHELYWSIHELQVFGQPADHVDE